MAHDRFHLARLIPVESLPQPPSGEQIGKAEWRKWAKQARSRLNPVETGGAISDSLQRWLPFRSARRVLVYLAFAGEPSLAQLLEGGEKEFLITRTEAKSGLLTVHRFHPGMLERHPFGFLQAAEHTPPVGLDQIELALVPGLAFDRRGNRLGFGQGFYDRLLSHLDERVPRVGVVPTALLVPALPAEPHDVRMSHLASESGVLPTEADEATG